MQIGDTPLGGFAAMSFRQRAVVAATLIGALIALTVATNIDRSSGSGELLPEQREVVDGLAADGSCANLQVIVDKAESDRGVPFTDPANTDALIDYTRNAMAQVGCND
jgi:hypothetical protein